MFYDVLVSLCRARGITVTALARQMNIAKGSPSNWQRGASLNSDVVVRIAQYFGVSCDYLLGLDDVPSRSGEFCCTPEERHLVLTLRAASPQARRAAIAGMQATLDALMQPTPDDTSL